MSCSSSIGRVSLTESGDHSEGDQSMDVDEKPPKKATVKGDDLAEYNLDDYDEDESLVTGESGYTILHTL